MANRKACSVLITALVVFTGLRHAFVPAPASKAAPMAAAGGALSMLGAQAAHADKIDDAAKKLSEASYPFLKEIDWTSDVYAKLPTQNPLAVMKAILGPEHEDVIPSFIWMFAYCLCYINSTINPFCYALCNATFRKTYVRILTCKWGSKKKQPVHKYYYG